MSSLVKIIEQADQDRTLWCQVCGNDADKLHRLSPDPHGAGTLDACTGCYLKDVEVA